MRYRRVPQISSIKLSVQVENETAASQLISVLTSPFFLRNMTTGACVVINETLAELNGLTYQNQNCSETFPEMTSPPRLVTGNSTCYGCVDRAFALNMSIKEQCTSCCKIRCMEGYVVAKSQQSIFTSTYGFQSVAYQVSLARLVLLHSLEAYLSVSNPFSARPRTRTVCHLAHRIRTSQL